MPSVCFATIRLQRSFASSLLLPIMRCPMCDTLLMRNLFIGHQLGLNQLILICRGQDCFLNTDRFQLVSWLSMPFCTSFSACVQYLFPVSFHFITYNLIYGHICFDFFVYVDYFGLLPTSGDNFMSLAPSEIYLLRKMLTCSKYYFPRCIYTVLCKILGHHLICCFSNAIMTICNYFSVSLLEYNQKIKEMCMQY